MTFKELNNVYEVLELATKLLLNQAPVPRICAQAYNSWVMGIFKGKILSIES